VPRASATELELRFLQPEVVIGDRDAGGLVEAVLSGEGGVSVEGLVENAGEVLGGVERVRLVGDNGLVGLSASCEGDVGVLAGGAGLEDGDADVNGVALVAVPGDGPPELDVLPGVVGRQDRGPSLGMTDGETPGRIDRLDGPCLAVADRIVVARPRRGVVPSGGDLVADVGAGSVPDLGREVLFGVRGERLE
jgi:hypothetical protein